MNTIHHNLTWVRLSSLSHSSKAAPPLPGIYAIGLVKTKASLPVAIDWLYIGKSKNLKRRLTEHLPIFETNPGLQAWISNINHSAEVWYTLVPDILLKTVESYLISELNTKYNRTKK